MSETSSISSQILFRILSSRSPELGARLKQRLKKEFVAGGFGEFDEKSLGFSRFTDYLRHNHGDLVEVVKDEQGSDVLVFLRNPPSSLKRQVHQAGNLASFPKKKPSIRSEIWLAFVNPDPARRRFLNIETGRVVHFLDGEGSIEQRMVECSEKEYIEIPAISVETQSGWMKEFVRNLSEISEEKREALEVISDGDYSNSKNAEFRRLLGDSGSAWRHYRVGQVIGKIEEWHGRHQVPLSMIYADEYGEGADFCRPAADREFAKSKVTPKQKVVKLLELLSEDDVSTLVLPTLLSTILIKSRQ